MKTLLISFLLAGKVFAADITLDDLAAKQTVDTISPVSLKGTYFSTQELSQEDVNKRYPALICGAFGYKQLIGFKTEKCPKGSKVTEYDSYGGVAALSSIYECTGSDGDPERFASITCAK